MSKCNRILKSGDKIVSGGTFKGNPQLDRVD